MLAERPSTQIVGNRYHLHEKLGAGGMGMVYRATDKITGRTVALKRTTTTMAALDPAETPNFDQSCKALAKEYKTLAALQHPHIIRVYDYGVDEESLPFYTMPLLEGAKDILEAARSLRPAQKVGLLIQLLEAVSYLHQQRVLHRDLKPANIMVVNGVVKLLDFGLAIERDFNDALVSGTLNYLAPEVLMGKSASEASDLYAIGIIAYEMFAGHHPFKAKDRPDNIMQMIYSLVNEDIDVTRLDVEEPIAQVIGKLIARQPENRYHQADHVIRDLRQALNPDTKLM